MVPEIFNCRISQLSTKKIRWNLCFESTTTQLSASVRSCKAFPSLCVERIQNFLPRITACKICRGQGGLMKNKLFPCFCLPEQIFSMWETGKVDFFIKSDKIRTQHFCYPTKRSKKFKREKKITKPVFQVFSAILGPNKVCFSQKKSRVYFLAERGEGGKNIVSDMVINILLFFDPWSAL